MRIVVGFVAGGPSDIAARVVAQWLSERLGQPFIVENRPGASGNIATEWPSQGASGRYTLLLVASTNAVNATLYDKLGFHFSQEPGRWLVLSRAVRHGDQYLGSSENRP